MLRSLYSGISGLRAHQMMLDVTGNNIANVNTIGFKSSVVQFQDTLSQMLGAAGAPQNNMGGTNPAQVGLGVHNAGILANFAQGSQETTGRSGDMMVQGDGFFVVRNGKEDLFTRAGQFSFDGNGLLVNPQGEPVQGWSAVNGVVNTAAKPDDIKMPLGSTIAPAATTKITLKGNLTSDQPADTTITTYTTTIPVKVYDNLGATSTVVTQFSRPVNPSTDTWTITLPYTGTGSDPTTTMNFVNGRPDTTTLNSDGKTITVGGYNVDVSDLTSYSGLTDARVFDTDGNAAGSLTSLAYSVSDTGELVGVYSNGLKEVLGQVAMATFKNVDGLEKTGDSDFRATVNSGYAQIGVPGSAGMGAVVSGALEMSNTDLAQEFTNLIIAQRGFQANSRVITTSDEILQELVGLKR